MTNRDAPLVGLQGTHEGPPPGGVAAHGRHLGSEGDGTASDADPLLGVVIEGRYRLLEKIGSGGMAVVYRAREQGLFSRDVAIKLLSPESSVSQDIVQRFLKEAQVIARIQHRNVISLHHAGKTETGQLYLAMELLSGRTLGDEFLALRARGEVFSWARLAPIMLQVCGALHAAHKQKIIHRDVKPGNCFLVRDDDDEGQEFVKVLDFGIAKVQPVPLGSDGGEENPETQQGMFLGTPHYAAPETIEPDRTRPIDGRADMFAAGVMMYQLLTGTLPFAGLSRLAALDRTVRERPPSPRARAPERGIPPEVDALIMKAMARHPDERYVSMIALSDAIRATSSGANSFSAGASANSGKGLVSGSITEIRAPSPVPASASGVAAARKPQEQKPRAASSRDSMTLEGQPAKTPRVVVHGPGVSKGRPGQQESAPPPGENEATPEAMSVRGPVGLSSRSLIKTVEQPVATRKTSAGMLLATTLMLLGMVAVVAVLVFEANHQGPKEATIDTTMSAGSIDSSEEEPGPAVPPPAPPPTQEPTPLANVAEVDPENIEGQAIENNPGPGGEVESVPGPDEARAERIRKISMQVRSMARDKGVLGCVIGKVPLGIDVKSQVALKLRIDAEGSVIAISPRSAKKGTRPLPVDAVQCVVERVRRARFPRGLDPALEVLSAVEFM